MADKYINLSAGLSAICDWIKSKLSQKQDALVSGTNIKTIDGASILGAGNIDTGDAFVATYGVTSYADLTAAIAADKVILLSMTANQNLFCMTYSTYHNGGNAIMHAIFNYNGHPTLMTATLTPADNWTISHDRLQGELVSGTNIKTVNNQSLLGSGNIDIQGGGGDAFIAIINTTSAADIIAADSAGQVILVRWSMVNSAVWVACQVHRQSATQVDIGFCLVEYDSVEGTPFPYVLAYRVTDNGASTTWESQETFKLIDEQEFQDAIDEVSQKIPTQATDVTFGTVKMNPDKAITMNADGQLEVGGRMGQFPTSTGIYAPNNRAPRAVGDYSFLMTDALGMDLAANRSMAIVSGYGMTCQSAAAGATEYRVTNNYANRIICKMAEGGYAALNEAESTTTQIVKITSVTINGAAFTPDSAADSSTPIVIKTAETLNPTGATTSIRLFGKMGSYATAHFGNGVASDSGGRCLLVGGGIRKSGSSNDNLLVGNGIFSSGNGVAAFGRYHIARKNRGLLAGTGHDTTNAPSEGASAVGQYSLMDAYTLFAVGNGSSHTNRSNAFEVRSDGIVIKSPNGTRFKIAVDDSGNLSAAPV